MLFDDFNRTNASRKSSRENDFAFLNRSARPEIGRVREFLEKLATEYPVDERDELASRIRSGNNVHFRSASFELLLYSFLVKLGYTLRPHPQLNNGSPKRPDFHVTTPGGDELFLEAVLASSKDGQDPSADARIATTLDVLATGTHPNFFVYVRTAGTPTTQPSGSRLLSETLKWLDTLDPDEVKSSLQDCDRGAREVFRWSHEDWDVELEAIPVSPERRGKATTLIGMRHGGVGIVDEWSPIRDAVKLKGSRYGEIDKPLLVAVNMGSFHLERIDEMQALYGQEQFKFTVGQNQGDPTFSRAQNGAWHGKRGPQSTRVSGAWIFADLSPYTVASRRQTIYVHPWAKRPLSEDLMQFPHAVLEGGKVVWHEGVSLREAFVLDKRWPE